MQFLMKAKKYVSLYLISLLSGRSKNNSFPIAKVCALIDLHRMTIFFLACEGTGQGGWGFWLVCALRFTKVCAPTDLPRRFVVGL
jgi:hypothetical protein